jgi:hypothetical protein
LVSKGEIRNRIIRIIAATRFPFVDQTDWGEGYVTIVNDEVKRRGIETEEGVVYPSIVITLADGRMQEIGEVEPEDGVAVAQVPKWKLFSETAGMGRRVKKFFLYVPEGLEEKAQKLLENNKIEYAGLRTYVISDGNLVVIPITTPDCEHDHR